MCDDQISYSFMHEGEEFGNINPQRGIRQGDTISPYLYILCVEILSSIMRRYEDARLIHASSIAKGAPHISHLLFDDDSYFFFKGNEIEALQIRNMLHRYERILGHAINLRKSNVVFSPNTNAADRARVCNILQVTEAQTPGN